MGCSCNKNPCACTPIDSGGCCTTSTSSTCCTPVVAKPVVTTDCPNAPVRMGVEDLTFGCEVEVQLRHCTNVKVTQIHSDHLLYCPTGRPISYYLSELIRMFPYIECQMGRATIDYGAWDDAVIVCEVTCCVEGMEPTVEQRLTFQEGDVVTHEGCLWISLVNGNISEPGASSADACEGTGPEWLCLTSIECRLATLEACVVPAGMPTICERVTDLEACVLPEEGATLCERVTDLETCCEELVAGGGWEVGGKYVVGDIVSAADGNTKFDPGNPEDRGNHSLFVCVTAHTATLPPMNIATTPPTLNPQWKYASSEWQGASKWVIQDGNPEPGVAQGVVDGDILIVWEE